MLWLRLDDEGALQRQLYRALREAVLTGRLRAGERLPSTRELARELSVSRNTVLLALERLLAEGFVQARPGAGTFVAQALRAPVRRGVAARAKAEPRLSAAGERMRAAVAPGRASWRPQQKPVSHDFLYGEPSYADLPLETWARILGRRARGISARRLAYQAPGGAPELREALAGYLSRARGVVCAPEQIVIVHGSQQAIDLVTRLLVDPGSPVVVEDPLYTGFSFCLRAAGAELHRIPVDAQGIQTERLAALQGVRLACVTPSHQYPTGEVMSLERRLALLAFAERSGCFVLEDDYDGEFNFGDSPIECLQALDRSGRAIYVGTASKLLFPALRIGWIVAPEPLVPHLLNAKALADTGTPSLEQLALADFIAEGHLERHARRARVRTAARRKVLLEALGAELGGRVRVRGASAGLHVLLALPSLRARATSALRAECVARGVGVYSAAGFYAKPPPHVELLLGYAALDPRRIREGVRRLRSAIDAIGG